MPLDPSTGVHWQLHGSGIPLLVGLPLMASHTAIFGAEAEPILRGYLERLVDRYAVLLVDYPSAPEEAAMMEKLAGAGFCAHRAVANIGHNPARMTFLARRA